MSSSSNKRFHDHLQVALFLASAFTAFVGPAGCDDPVTPVADDGRVKQVLSAGCRAEKTTPLLKGYQSKTPMMVKGVDRTYDWLIPDAHDGRHPIPIIFVFHGDGGTGAGIREQFKIEDAVGGKAIIVYPDATTAKLSWDLERGADTNADMIFYDQILATISDNYCIDTNRVFVAGVSRGAYFANQLGCLRGGSIRAIAAHSGGGPASEQYSETGKLECPEKPVAALIVHGTADTEVPLSEGQASRDHWDEVNGCRPGGLEVFDPAPCRNQLNCAHDRPVVYCEIPDLGHAVWSEGPKATWNFFNQL